MTDRNWAIGKITFLITAIIIIIASGISISPKGHGLLLFLWLLRWIMGLFFSLEIGSVVTPLALKEIKTYAEYLFRKKDYRLLLTTKIPDFPWLVGLFERLFFTLIVAFNVNGTAIAIIGWITVKTYTTHWFERDWDKVTPSKLDVYISLMASMVSMMFALIGGLICNKNIPLVLGLILILIFLYLTLKKQKRIPKRLIRKCKVYNAWEKTGRVSNP